LVDSIPVTPLIGPGCRAGFDGGITPEPQDAANKLTHLAALAAQEGRIEEVRTHAKAIRDLGLTVLAYKVGSAS